MISISSKLALPWRSHKLFWKLRVAALLYSPLHSCIVLLEAGLSIIFQNTFNKKFAEFSRGLVFIYLSLPQESHLYLHTGDDCWLPANGSHCRLCNEFKRGRIKKSGSLGEGQDQSRRRSGCMSCLEHCSEVQPCIISCQKFPWSHHLPGKELGLSSTLIPELPLISDQRSCSRLSSKSRPLRDRPFVFHFDLTVSSILNNAVSQSATETLNIFYKQN